MARRTCFVPTWGALAALSGGCDLGGVERAAHKPPATLATSPYPNEATPLPSTIATTAYAPRPSTEGPVTRAAQDLRGTFGAGGLVVADRSGAGEVTVSLRAWGRGPALEAVEPVPPEEGACLANGARDSLGDCLRRIQYARPGLVEWWETQRDGFEHGFTVTAPPDGEGALVLDLVVGGASVEVDGAGDAARWARPFGAPLRYGALAAWDEAGRSLPAWMEESEHGLRLVVDDEGAFGTVTVDPLLAAEWVELGPLYLSHFGTALASAGDVNGDGYDDLVVGASGYANPDAYEGAAFLYLGSAGGLSSAPAWAVESDQAWASMGISVAGAGDVDSDGYSDVLVAATGYENGASNEGAVFLYRGSPTGPSTSPDWMMESNREESYFGHVASAGDVNGDGFSDVLIGNGTWSNGETHEGAAFVFLGSAAGLELAPVWTVETDQVWAYFGSPAASAGDVDGDGIADLVVGASRYDHGEEDEGVAFIYLGSPSGPSPVASSLLEVDQPDAEFGASVASAGDVDGDGTDDVLVGADHYDNGEIDEGAVFLYLGSAAGVSAAPDTMLESDQAEALFGTAAAGAGDLDGDGHGDVVVGAPAFDQGEDSEGAAFVYLGSPTGLATRSVWMIESNDYQALLGYSVASAGDVNADGFADVAVGSLLYGALFEGAAFVHYGATCFGSDAKADVDADGFAACEECDDTNRDVHPGAGERCDGVDEDCDGTADEEPVDAPTWYADTDGDGFTGADIAVACAPPDGYVAAPSAVVDCDDTDASVFPGGSEVPDDGVDQDCDGVDAHDGGGETGAETGGHTGPETGPDPETGAETESESEQGPPDETGVPTADPEPQDPKGCGCTTAAPRSAIGWLLPLSAWLALGRRGGPQARASGAQLRP